MFLGRAFVTCYKAEGEVVGWAVPLEARSSLSLALMETIYVIILHIISNLKIWRWGYFYIMSHIHFGFLNLFAGFFNSRWHDSSTVTGTILQQSLARLFNSQDNIFFLRWHDSSAVILTVEESCHVLGIRHMIP